jgi:transcriptional regulator with XRE-family HTH domain
VSGTHERRTLPPEAAAMLRQRRTEAGLSLRETARRAELAPSYLHALEHGTRCPSTAVAIALAEALDLPAGARALLLRCALPDAGYSRPRPLTDRA